MGSYASGIHVFKLDATYFLEQNIRVKPITPDHPISQDFNWPDHFLRGYLKDRVCKNNPQTREDIIRKDRAAAVLSYNSVVYGTSTILITGKV